MPSVTWDDTFETSPADTDEAKYGATKIRQLKVAVREREELEHNFKAGTQPFHLAGKSSVLYAGTTAQINALSGMAEGAIVFDEDLKSWKRYSGAAWVRKGDFPSGTKLGGFYQDTAPEGWVILNTLNDKLMFVTKGSAAGGQAGGTVHPAGSWTISGFDANVGNHTLTINEIPSHYHSFTTYQIGAGVGNLGTFNHYLNPVGVNTSNVGGGQAHNHPMASQNGTWRPAAYCCIICQRN